MSGTDSCHHKQPSKCSSMFFKDVKKEKKNKTNKNTA